MWNISGPMVELGPIPPSSHSATQLVSLTELGARERERERGHRVTPWPHQISPNPARCLAPVKTSNLKDIKCKCAGHMPTSNTAAPIQLQSSSGSKLFTGLTPMMVGGGKDDELLSSRPCAKLFSCWSRSLIRRTQKQASNCFYFLSWRRCWVRVLGDEKKKDK